MHDRARAWGALLLMLGCARSSATAPEADVPQEPATADASDADASDADASDADASDADANQAELLALDRCSEAVDRIMAKPVGERPEALAELSHAVSGCGQMLLGRCEVPPIASGQSSVDVIRGMIDACLARYCPRWSGTSSPALCEGGIDGFVDLPDVGTATAQAEGFIAAMLAEDYARPRSDGAVQRVARRFAPLWLTPVAIRIVVPPSLTQPVEDPLDLQVDITLHKITLRPGPEPEFEVPSAKLEALTRHAEALKAKYPAARTVTLHVAGDVSMQRLIEVMDALRGEGCTTSEPTPPCLFPMAVVTAED